MNVIDLEIPEVKLIVPTIHSDSRGYFFESYNDKDFKEKVCNTTFVQDNESCSSYLTVRGLHWQQAPYAQSKLVRVVKGSVYDVAVDIRVGSPTFGKSVGALLTTENHHQLFIPRGFAHGFMALGKSENIFQYKCDNLYNKESEAAIAWTSVDIDWPIDVEYFSTQGKLLLSAKDLGNPPLDKIDESKLFKYSVNYYE